MLQNIFPKLIQSASPANFHTESMVEGNYLIKTVFEIVAVKFQFNLITLQDGKYF